MQTVIETPQFIKQADKVMSGDDRKELIDFVAHNPLSGDEIKGTGGVRKVRFAIGNKGKSGGVRVIYFYYNENNPIFLFSVFAKSNKTNIDNNEKNELKKLTAALKAVMK